MKRIIVGLILVGLMAVLVLGQGTPLTPHNAKKIRGKKVSTDAPTDGYVYVYRSAGDSIAIEAQAGASGTVDSFYVIFTDSASVQNANKNTKGYITPGDTLYIDTTDNTGGAGGVWAFLDSTTFVLVNDSTGDTLMKVIENTTTTDLDASDNTAGFRFMNNINLNNNDIGAANRVILDTIETASGTSDIFIRGGGGGFGIKLEPAANTLSWTFLANRMTGEANALIVLDSVLAVAGNILVGSSLDLNSNDIIGIDSADIAKYTDGSIGEPDLIITNTPADNDLMAWDIASGGDFQWQTTTELGIAQNSEVGDTADVLRAEMPDSITTLNIFPRLDRDYFDTTLAGNDSIIVKLADSSGKALADAGGNTITSTYETIANVALIGDDTTNFKTAFDSTSAWDNRGYPDATTALKGIASFSTTNFSVTTGAVSIKAGGVSSNDILNDEVKSNDINYSSTLAGNPGFLGGESFFGTTGIIFEGTTVDTEEGLLTVEDITGLDKTWTLPNLTGTVAMLSNLNDTGNVLRAEMPDSVVSYVKVLQWHNIKDYGATGDGSTQDHVAIQKAADSAANDSSIVFVPNGTYVIGATITLNHGVTLMGTGTFKAKTSLDSDIITITSKNGVTIKDIRIDGNKANNDSTVPKSAILFTGCTNSRVANVTIVNMYGQSIGIGTEANASSDITVEDCTISGGTSNHIDVNSSQRISILNNDITGGYASGNGEDGIFMGHGLSEDNLVMGNVVDSAGNNGLSISNNKFSAVNSAVRRIKIIGNTLNYSQNNGIALHGVNHSIISNNECVGNNKGGTGGSGIYIANGFPTDITAPYDDTVASYRNIIIGNRCYDTASAGNIQTYGLHISPDSWSAGYSDSNLIAANDFSDNNTADDSIAGDANLIFQTDVSGVNELYADTVKIGDTTTGDKDGVLYFADDGSFTAEDIRWDDGLSRFVASKGLAVTGNLEAWSGDILSQGNLFINEDGVGSNLATINFFNAGSSGGSSLYLDSTLDKFFFSDPLDMTNNPIDSVTALEVDSLKSNADTVLVSDVLKIKDFTLYTAGNLYAQYDSTDTPTNGQMLTWGTGNVLNWTTPGAASVDIKIDSAGDGTNVVAVHPIIFKEGTNITLTVDANGDTVTIAGPASSGTADSVGVDTDGDGTVDGYMYSTTAGAAHLKKGGAITLTLDTDTTTIAVTADGIDTTYLKTTNLAVDEDIVTYEATGTGFEFHTPGELSLVLNSDVVDTAKILANASGGNFILEWQGDSLEMRDKTAGAQNLYIQTDGTDVLVVTMDTLKIGTDKIKQFTGNGLVLSLNAVVVQAGSANIVDQVIKGADIDSTASNVIFDDAFEGSSAFPDSQYSTHNWVRVEIGDTADILRAEMPDSGYVDRSVVKVDSIVYQIVSLPTQAGINDTVIEFIIDTSDGAVYMQRTSGGALVFHGSADSSGKALQDAGGNTITSTYETITNVALIGDDTTTWNSVATAFDTNYVELDVDSLRVSNAIFISGDSIVDFAGTNLSVTNGVLNASGGGGTDSSMYVDSIMVEGNTETGITVTFNTVDTTMDYVVAVSTSEIIDQTILNADIDTTAEDFVFDDAYRVTSAVAGSLLVTAASIGDTAAALRDGDTWTGTHDYSGATLEIPNSNNPTTTNVGELTYDANNNAIEGTDGTVDFLIASKLKMFSMTIDDPDNLVSDTIMILPVEIEAFPFGITLIDLGIKTWAATTYSVTFWEYTEPGNGGTETQIEGAIATSASREAEDDGTLTDGSIAAGSIIMAILPATDIAQLQLWGTYYVNEGN